MLDVETGRKVKDIKLPGGTSSVRQIAINPNDDWAYVVHTIGRTGLPASRLEGGWVNVNAFTVLDLRKWEVYASLLLDNPTEGAADPWGVAVAPDGSRLWITLAGIHQLATINLPKLHQYLRGEMPEEDIAAVLAYLQSLQPVPSPYRDPDGGLSAAARRGEALFLNESARCAHCHPPPLYTDLKQHNVGTQSPQDESPRFDTPSLVESYRTAPYLHDGSAADLMELLTLRNPQNQHGVTSSLSPADLNDLVEFLLSL